MSLFPQVTGKAKAEKGGKESGANPSISCVAFAVVRKNGRLCSLRRIEIEDGIVVRFTETVPDVRDICLAKAEEGMIDETEKA